jgi:hypothetical protein
MQSSHSKDIWDVHSVITYPLPEGFLVIHLLLYSFMARRMRCDAVGSIISDLLWAVLKSLYGMLHSILKIVLLLTNSLSGMYVCTLPWIYSHGWGVNELSSHLVYNIIQRPIHMFLSDIFAFYIFTIKTVMAPPLASQQPSYSSIWISHAVFEYDLYRKTNAGASAKIEYTGLKKYVMLAGPLVG